MTSQRLSCEREKLLYNQIVPKEIIRILLFLIHIYVHSVVQMNVFLVYIQ